MLNIKRRIERSGQQTFPRPDWRIKPRPADTYSGSSQEWIVGTAVTVCFYALSDAKPLRNFAGNAI
jgi:hypothetical protein